MVDATPKPAQLSLHRRQPVLSQPGPRKPEAAGEPSPAVRALDGRERRERAGALGHLPGVPA